MWPRDILVPLFKNGRIATYSYKSDWRDRSIKTSLDQCAEQFLNILHQYRQKPQERQRPIILIGHSLGGLVIQQALVGAALDKQFSDIRFSVAGIIFLGTPFQGSNAAGLGDFMARLGGLDSTLLKLLQKDNPELHKLSRNFWSGYAHLDIVCFYENRDADFKLLRAQFVSTQSASLHGKRMMFLDTDHSGLIKFTGINDENFALFLPEIKRMVNAKPAALTQHKKSDYISENSSIHSRNKHWIVPRPVNKLFTGRDKILTKIQFALTQIQSPPKEKRIVITGMGGQGKSEICLKVADTLRESFWGVFWVDVDNPSIARNGFLSIAKSLGKSAESVEEVCRLLANIEESWLLILDNADDPKFDYQIYILSGTYGSVIMTSRIPNCGHQYNTIDWGQLDSLEKSQATELLLKSARIPEVEWPSCLQKAADVIELLGSHTLAIIQAGAYIARDHSRLNRYPEIFQRQRKRLLEFRPDQATSRYGNVYATFEASAEILEKSKDQDSQDALSLLGVLSMLHSGFLLLSCFEYAWWGSRKAFSRGKENSDLNTFSLWHASQLPDFLSVKDSEWDDYRLVEAISILESFSFISRAVVGGSPVIFMHPVAQSWARDRQQTSQQTQIWISTSCMLGFLVYYYPSIKLGRYLRPHLHTFLDTIDVKTMFLLVPRQFIIPILVGLGLMLRKLQDISKLRQFIDDIFVELEIERNKPTKNLISLYSIRASCLEDLLLYQEALSLREKIFEIEKVDLVENDPKMLSLQHNLAINYRSNGDCAKAIDILERLVQIRNPTLAEDDNSRLRLLHSLARTYLEIAKFPEAIKLFENIIRFKTDESDVSRLSSEHELSRAYLATQQIPKAISLLERIARFEATIFWEDHPRRLTSEHELGRAYLENKQFPEAIYLLENVVRIQGTTLTENHPHRLLSEHVLARAYIGNKQFSLAIGLLQKVVRIQTMTFADDSLDRFASEYELFEAYYENGQLEKAINIMMRVVQVRAASPADDEFRLSAEHALGRAYYKDGQVNKATNLIDHVENIRKTSGQLGNRRRLASERSLSKAYYADGKVEKAIDLLTHIVQIRETMLLNDDPELLESRELLAKFRGETEETEPSK